MLGLTIQTCAQRVAEAQLRRKLPFSASVVQNRSTVKF